MVTREDGATRTSGVFAAVLEPPPMGAAIEGGVTVGVRVSVWRCGGVLFTDGAGLLLIGVITLARGNEMLLPAEGAEVFAEGGVITVGCCLVEMEVPGRRAISTERFTGGA